MGFRQQPFGLRDVLLYRDAFLTRSLAGAISRAADRIRTHIRETPVEPSPFLSREGGGSVHLKLESHQITGSFKVRGAFNKLLTLPDEIRRRGVIAASSGNHGAAVAHAAAELGVGATLYVPDSITAGKRQLIVSLGGEVREAGDDTLLAELAARRAATESGRAYISPYNDPEVIVGQGTLGVELGRQLPEVEAVFLALGGGGLLAGVGSYLAGLPKPPRIIACSPANSCVMHRSLEAGEILDLPSLPTLSDGTAGGVEAGAITFDICRQRVDESVLVSEEEIAAALRLILARHHTLIEGAAAVAVAGYRQQARRWAGKTVAIVLCGANISLSTLRSVLAAEVAGGTIRSPTDP